MSDRIEIAAKCSIEFWRNGTTSEERLYSLAEHYAAANGVDFQAVLTRAYELRHPWERN